MTFTASMSPVGHYASQFIPSAFEALLPGESTPPNFATNEFGSHWPDGGVSRPRSSTIVITREDGGDITL
jgi:hypothetical protein